MKYGFTTGSCAAAAAKAAAYMLLTGRRKNCIHIMTPKGIDFSAEILDIQRGETEVRCAVQKDGGDDPDVTSGAKINATVTIIQESCPQGPVLRIDGGIGVGRVTMPGLDQPVGNAAINHVPREMIAKEVGEVCAFCDFTGILGIEISVPKGEEIAEKTFNPRLGIKGGISILGTSGIVEPMSTKALLDTIWVELRQKRELGMEYIAVSPGNYGLDYMKKTYGYDLDQSVKCSNYIGDTIDMAKELGFCGMLLTGHIGKLVKVAGGMMNTHSKEGDCRMEVLAAAAKKSGANKEQQEAVLGCVSTEQAIRILEEEGLKDETMKEIVEKVKFNLNKKYGEGMPIECIIYGNSFGELGRTEKALDFLEKLMGGRKEK